MLLLCLMQYFIVKIMCNCHSTAPWLPHSFTEEKSTKEWKKWKCMEMEEAEWNISEYAHFCLFSFQHLLLEITNVLADKFYVRLSSLKLLVLCCYFISSCWVRQEKKFLICMEVYFACIGMLDNTCICTERLCGLPALNREALA